LAAFGHNGQALGRIEEFRTTPAGPVAVIRGERQHWVPFVKERIVAVDLDAGRVVFDWAADW
jgi:16S rRNA processing protein RimM